LRMRESSGSALTEKIREAMDCADAMYTYRKLSHKTFLVSDDVTLELESLRAFKRSVDEALNSGDGTYRP